METINIFDKNFIPYDPCSTHGKIPKNIQYVTGEKTWDGITLYTDKCFDEVKNTKSKINVAWQVESPVHSNKHFYPAINKYWDKFDYILTYDHGLVEKFPNKCKPVNFGGTTVHEPQLYEKTKDVCIVHSGKKDTPNHQMRFDIINKLSNVIDVYGRVTGKPFDNIADVYKDYRYAIIVENINTRNYFSEKLTDAIACGCVPIYNGCNRPVVDIFDMKSIPTFSYFSDLVGSALSCINPEFYDSNIKSIETNLNIVKKDFYTNEDWLYKTYFKEWLKN